MSKRLKLKNYNIHKIFNHDYVESNQYGLDMIKAKEVWDISEKGRGVVIAVIDSGCDIKHPALKDKIIDYKNLTDENKGIPDDVTDYLGHGTHVAGIIAAGNKGEETGVAPNSKLLIIKAIDQDSSASYETIIAAIEIAINWRGPNNEKTSIINMSVGGKVHSELLFRAIKKAVEKGITVVVAAGNEGDGRAETYEYSFPGFYKNVIQISSANKSGNVSEFSNSNLNIDFIAPGENILSTHIDGQYASLSGTSMAAPHASGAIALIINILKKQGKAVDQCSIYDYLLSTTKDLGYSYSQQGNGLIQLK
ncbi:major intracellular serine protease [Sporosarcina luteola]|nr:major intracellular serine protease [Sporosarcina luteola]